MSNTSKGTKLLAIRLFAGIDSSKKNNQCCIVDHNGKVIKEINVTNNVTGAHKLEAVLSENARKLQSQELKIATESTSFYDFHILEFLSESEVLGEHNLKLYRFNPRPVKAFKDSLKLMDKADPQDAYAVAEYLRFRGEKAEEYRAKMDHLPLQRLTRFRWHLVEQLVRERNYFLNQLFLKFSAFGRNEPFSDTMGATAVAVIQEFMTPDAVANASDEELVDFVIKHGCHQAWQESLC